ncbi:dihydrodipicolinate reductase C-terminal domain-containing protein [Micromonospora sp. NPDC093277]|uniref:dihydrodipicolinate reductase C-terminal domain-containing protein n=1 Tax=Micromonospora sp. NPDC093277 TaxID=3364291 RepID=UPI00381BF09A
MGAEPLRIGVVGAAGRLGSRIVAECQRQGIPVPFAAIRNHWPMTCDVDVVIDASRGEVLPRTAELCHRSAAALVVCASDLTDDAPALLADLARRVAVVRAVNLSVGHWMQCHLLTVAGRIAARLPGQSQLSVLERHPPRKVDRPSASATTIAANWTAVTGRPVAEVASYRAGLAVCEHRADLSLEHETLTLHHDVRSLDAAVFGALLAASWAREAPPGLVSVAELFNHAFLQEVR